MKIERHRQQYTKEKASGEDRKEYRWSPSKGSSKATSLTMMQLSQYSVQQNLKKLGMPKLSYNLQECMAGNNCTYMKTKNWMISY